jgi:hypothetical protein
MFGGGAAAPAEPEPEAASDLGGFDLSSLLGGAAAAPAAPAAEEEAIPEDNEKQMLMKLLSRM